MNPLLTTQKEAFRVGKNNLEFFQKRLVKMENGVLFFCTKGEADISIDMEKHHIVPNTNFMLLPNTTLSRISATKDFETHFFAFSEEMFNTASFRLAPPFIHFLKKNASHTHAKNENVLPIMGLIEASNAIYNDTNNLFRRAIAQNLLQIFFLDVYDKTQRFFIQEHREGSNRKEELFKRFISLIHTYNKRDVSFYAAQLCISPRYLSTITQEIENCSAKSIIDNHLVLELKVALQSTNLSLKEIADNYHFPDQSFFGRFFKKHTGMSPKAFRHLPATKQISIPDRVAVPVGP